MKNYIYIFTTIFLFGLSSCDAIDYKGEYSKDGVYGEKPQVYFSQTNNNDTISHYSFGSKPLSFKRQTVNVSVSMAGMLQNRDLKFRVVVDSRESTAQPNVHYVPINSEYKIIPNKTTHNIPIELIRDNLGTENSVPMKIVLRLEATDDLGTSFSSYNKRIVTFDNYLAEPEWWVYYVPFFGPYSRNKYLKLLEYYDSDEQKLLDAFSEFNGIMLNFQKVYKFFKNNPDYPDEIFPDENAMLIPYQ